MAARSIGSATISFGLVSIPTHLYVATHSERLAFNMLHEACGTRMRRCRSAGRNGLGRGDAGQISSCSPAIHR